MNDENQDVTKNTEAIIRKYFEKRHWSITKLDIGNDSAADFKIQSSDFAFLCEVKTIESERVYKKATENVKNSSSHSFIRYADEVKELRNHSMLKNLPYAVRIHSDDLFLPNPQDREKFKRWLIQEIQNIHQGNISRDWKQDQLGYGQFYKFRNETKDCQGTLQLEINKQLIGDNLSIDFHYSGDLNIEAISRNVEKGIQQLEYSAKREDTLQIPRIIILRFPSGYVFLEKELDKAIRELISNNISLSAIAISIWAYKIHEKPNTLIDWIFTFFHSNRRRAFTVYHNSKLQDINKLPNYIFDDNFSEQITV